MHDSVMEFIHWEFAVANAYPSTVCEGTSCIAVYGAIWSFLNTNIELPYKQENQRDVIQNDREWNQKTFCRRRYSHFTYLDSSRL